jgi:hypothetical protein
MDSVRCRNPRIRQGVSGGRAVSWSGPWRLCATRQPRPLDSGLARLGDVSQWRWASRSARTGGVASTGQTVRRAPRACKGPGGCCGSSGGLCDHGDRGAFPMVAGGAGPGRAAPCRGAVPLRRRTRGCASAQSHRAGTAGHARRPVRVRHPAAAECAGSATQPDALRLACGRSASWVSWDRSRRVPAANRLSRLCRPCRPCCGRPDLG